MARSQRRPQRSARGGGQVRIIGGKWRGRRLPVADAPGLRPTGDRLRETLFNWIGSELHGARCLDLFAGTGALGIEALSRGAATCTFVERDRRAVASLRDALERLDAGEAAQVCAGDSLAWLRAAGERFDIVFVDPPFGDAVAAAALNGLGDGKLAAAALVYLEYPRGEGPPIPDAFTVHRHKESGAVGIDLLRLNATEAGPGAD